MKNLQKNWSRGWPYLQRVFYLQMRCPADSFFYKKQVKVDIWIHENSAEIIVGHRCEEREILQK